MFNIVQPNSISLQVVPWDDFLHGKKEFKEWIVDVNSIKSIKPVLLFNKIYWSLEFMYDERPFFVIKDFDAYEFLRCVSKLEKANCLFGVEPDKNYIWRLSKLDDMNLSKIDQKEISKMSTRKTVKAEQQPTEKKVKANATNGAKKDQKTTTTKKPETKTEFTKEDVPTIAKISFFGPNDDSSFVVNLSNGCTEVVQNDASHDKLKNRIALMENRGYHIVENKAERSLTFEPNMKPEDVKDVLDQIITEQLNRSNGKFYYVDFNKLPKEDIDCITNGVNSSPDTPREAILFMIGYVLKLMAIGDVADLDSNKEFINNVRIMLDALKSTDECISDALGIKPAIGTTVKDVNGESRPSGAQRRCVTQRERDNIKEFVKSLDELMDALF